MLSIQSISFSQDEEVIEPSFVKVAPYIQGTLGTNYMKRPLNSNGVCYLKLYRSSNDLNLFMFNIFLKQTLLCVITQIQIATKISVVFVRNFIMKMKRGFSVLLQDMILFS